MRSLILIFALFFLFSSCSTSGDDPEAKNVELQTLEIEIYSKIQQGDKEGAFDLLKKLNHPSNKEWEEKQEMDDWNLFLKKRYTYNEWWSERRESLRIEIEKINNKPKNNSQNKKNTSYDSKSSKEENTKVKKEIDKAIKVPIRYLGLYVFQYENGSTQFYKLFKDANNVYSAVYQDNISGNVRIENYIVKDFDDKTGEIKLQSKKDKRSITELLFVKDFESDNGFKLVDKEGLTYNYIL